MALDRMQVAKECGDNLACYGKTLNDPSWTRAEKAAFALAFSGNSKQALPLLLAAMKPITTMAQDRYPVHQAILFGLARLGTKDCKECIEKLDAQIARDEKAVRIPGARDLLGETRVTEAIIQNQGAGDLAPRPAATVATAEDASGHAERQGEGREEGRQGRQGRREEEAPLKRRSCFVATPPGAGASPTPGEPGTQSGRRPKGPLDRRVTHRCRVARSPHDALRGRRRRCRPEWHALGEATWRRMDSGAVMRAKG